MSVQNKIDNEFSVLVDNISKIALAIERKGVHSSGELANYAAEIDSILVGSNSGEGGSAEITEEKKKAIILEFAKSLGYKNADEIASVYSVASKSLEIAKFNENGYGSSNFDRYNSIGCLAFNITDKIELSRVTFKYTLTSYNGNIFESDVQTVEDGLNCAVKHLDEVNDSLVGRLPSRNHIMFLAKINMPSINNELESYKIEVFVDGKPIDFSKSGIGVNDNTRGIYSNILGETVGHLVGHVDFDFEDSYSSFVASRKLTFLVKTDEGSTTLTTYDDSPMCKRFGNMNFLYADSFGFADKVKQLTSLSDFGNITTVTTASIDSGVTQNVLYNIRMDYDYVNTFVSKGLIYKFVPAYIGLAVDSGFVGMVGAKESIGVTLWTGEVVVFPKGTNKYNLKTKTFEPWDGESFESYDQL